MSRLPVEKPLRVVLAGAGEWGASWANEVHAAPGFELAAIVDLNVELGTRAAAAVGLASTSVFDSISAAIEAESLDAAVIAVPPQVHCQVALEALDAHLHCLIEKPLAPSLEECREIISRGRGAGVVVMVSQNYGFRAGSRTVRRLIAEGTIGPIGTVGISFMRSFAPTGFRAEMEEPLLLDMAVHHFDQLRTVLGLEPTSVWARTSNPSWSPFQGNAEGIARFETDAGACISYVGSWASRGLQTGWGGCWEIQGDEGALRWEDDRVVVYPREQQAAKSRRWGRPRDSNGTGIDLDPGPPGDRAGVLEEFRSAIGERREPRSSAADNIRTIALVTAAAESSRVGVPVVPAYGDRG